MADMTNNSTIYYTVYAERANISFVMKEYEIDGDGLIDSIGFYFGKPNEKEDNEIILADQRKGTDK